ncbi:type I-U CRISPR-associated helicase/endonuclease Cas3 [Gordonia sp. (in: high G+C Gram-positive bacteria)]|uniref:type I-G CRISPR-associated helicase/endonuclease Cas3g n=1 Tax=Gordonia sp. (in: high G+C Gram-positive bacteria) TaxID=84139 RepID=UPI0035271200
MNALREDEFAEFFEQVNGCRPFQWQIRLLRFVLAHGRWPDAITAPTGSGKSSVVDVHLFVNALHSCESGPRVPRRLAVVVGRRAIVDSHETHARELRKELRKADPGSVAGRVATCLARLRSGPAGDSAFEVSTLRGGMPTDSNWIDDPSACAVICATPDMFGSRLLFGGYGSTPAAWPREAGTLARDTVMVLDEAHLNEQLLFTARRVGHLQSAAEVPADEMSVPVIQVVATTATPATGDRYSVGVERDDLSIDSTLRDRLEKPKPIELVETRNWPGARRPSRNYAREIAEQVMRKVAERDGVGTVGCIVNSVFTAREVARIVGDSCGDEAVILWVGPMRPRDLESIRDSHRELFTAVDDRDREIRVIVSTQTLEVGVDIDLAALVTELAPGSSLAQRAGRVNRLGRRDRGDCVVLLPDSVPTASTGPYQQDELADGFEWLKRRADDPAGFAPIRLVDDPPPPRARRRPVLSRLELGTAQYLSSTSETEVGDVELDFWIRDDLRDNDLGLGMVRRSPLPVDDIDALALLRATPIVADEIYPVKINTARDVVESVIRTARQPFARVFRERAGELEIVDLSGLEGIEIRPGDILIVDGEHRIVDNQVITARDGEAPGDTAWAARGRFAEVFVDGHAADWITLRETAEAMYDARENPPEGMADDEAVQAAAERVLKSRCDTDRPVRGTVPPLPDDQSTRLGWAVVTEVDADKTDEETRQVWTGPPVPLQKHRIAVAECARELGRKLGLSDLLADVLYSAGLLHDEGKRHSEFQRILAAQPGEVLAKSGARDAGVPRRRRSGVGLVRGWRHEQLSVVYAAAELESTPVEIRDLVLRLVGTSHGRGRMGFALGSTDVLAGETQQWSALAAELFDEGSWDELMEATDRRWGTWTCAYLEAVLRAADCMVSKEGS